MFMEFKPLVNNNPDVSETVNPLNGLVVRGGLSVGVVTTREPNNIRFYKNCSTHEIAIIALMIYI